MQPATSAALGAFATCRVDPGTLRVGGGSYDPVLALYAEHREQLGPLCAEMETVRGAMLARGYSADFSDREAELLYLLIRQVQPDVVVEVSPRHGYTTNYILAALTHNRRGELWSYEITEQENGIPIEEVIRGNLSARVEQERLRLVVGDARDAEIPRADVLFIDSCHEAYFAGWYLTELVHRASVVFVHDILMRSGGGGTLAPKAALLGVREQYYLLQALHQNDVGLFSVADFGARVTAAKLGAPRARYLPLGWDRSVVFPGHAQSEASRSMHEQMASLHRAAHKALNGDRLGSLALCRSVLDGSAGPFMKCMAAQVLPSMGYRVPTAPEMFAGVELPAEPTVPELVAAMEVAVAAADPRLHRLARRAGKRSEIDRGVLRLLVDGYFDLQRGARAGRLRSLLRRLGRRGG